MIEAHHLKGKICLSKCLLYHNILYVCNGLYTRISVAWWFEKYNLSVIIALKQPSDRYTSVEAITYIQNIMIQQTLRQTNKRVDAFLADISARVDKYIAAKTQQPETKIE